MSQYDILGEILQACMDEAQTFSDVIIHEGFPIIAQSAAGNAPLNGKRTVSHEDIQAFAMRVHSMSRPASEETLLADTMGRLKSGAIKEALDWDLDDGGNARRIRLRFTIVKSGGGKRLAAVVRHIPQTIPSLKDIGLPHDAMSLVKGSGLVLLTGPTKQGKSTTAAAMLQHVRDARPGHIVTIEDPIEYTLENLPDGTSLVTSLEVGSDVTSYQAGAADALRMNPTAIMIGEIRDEATARAALMLGESGHLVISTMQSTTVEGALFKLWALTAAHAGAQASISACVRGIVRTALVPHIDRKRYVPAFEFMLNQADFTKTFANIGDPAQTATQGLRKLIQDRPKLARSLNRSLMELVKSKQITAEAALESTNDPEELRQQLG